MASINLKNKSKADLVAIVRMSGVMPISKAQRMTKAALIEQLELIQAEQREQESSKEQDNSEEALLMSAPGRLAARQVSANKKKTTAVSTERRSVFVAPEEDEAVNQKTGRRSIMAAPDVASIAEEEATVKDAEVISEEEAKPAPTTKRASRTRTTKKTETKSTKPQEEKLVEEESVKTVETDEKKEVSKDDKKPARRKTTTRKKTTKAAEAAEVKEELETKATEDLEKAAVEAKVDETAEDSKSAKEDPETKPAERRTRSREQSRQTRSRQTKASDRQDEKRPESKQQSRKKDQQEKNTSEDLAQDTKAEEQKEEQQGTKERERKSFDSGEIVTGVMEIMPDGYGFLRRDNYLQGPKDIYVPPQFIRRFHLREGDLVSGPSRVQREQDRYQALYYINTVNGLPPEQMMRRPHFDRLTPIHPNSRYTLETSRNELSTRIIDLISPIGKGQRGMIVSPPKAGKTILLQKIANAIAINNPESKLIVLLIDERPEEVTDMQRSIRGEVVYSTFDKTPENHVKITELVLERAMRMVEMGEDVIILLDSLTRMARAYNLTINPTGRTLSGGLDPGALYGPKRFFGAARKIENGGSLTIVATALIDTGSRMDEVIFEEFKGTGNMEVYLDRKLSEKRIFPAIDVNRSSTRREELLLSEQELEAVWSIRRAFGSLDSSNVTETIINLLTKTNDNRHFVSSINVSLNNKSLYESMKLNGNKN